MIFVRIEPLKSSNDFKMFESMVKYSRFRRNNSFFQIKHIIFVARYGHSNSRM